MIKNADYVIVFWDGESRGTYSLLKFAKQNAKPYRIKQLAIENNNISVEESISLFSKIKKKIKNFRANL